MTRQLHTETLRRPWAAWWTVLVAVLFAMMPTLNHALASAGVMGANRIEICTAQGPKSVAQDNVHTVDSSNEQDSTLAQPHCPFCLHQADRCAPAPQPLPYLLKVEGAQQEMTDWQAFFILKRTRYARPPRGPPSQI